MADFRISCNVPSDYNAELLREWARITRRPIADLGSRLLEEGLNAAIRENRIPAFIFEQLNKDFNTPRGEAEPWDAIHSIQIQGDAFRKIYEQRQEERFNAAWKDFEEEAQKMDMNELKKLCDELPGI